RFDYLASYDEKFISLLERSGCVELNLGGESGSDRLLTYMHKDVSRDQMLCSVRNLRRWGASIEPVVSWISGIPTETEEDLKKTLDIMDQMTQENPRTQHQAIFIYTPFPNALLSDLDAKFTPPKSLE